MNFSCVEMGSTPPEDNENNAYGVEEEVFWGIHIQNSISDLSPATYGPILYQCKCWSRAQHLNGGNSKQ
ncbi:hypothetical protein Y1Q_0004339 [Alligator mississippiensis]|uniref:Uncharacterized protein n=1 Tax=Alligator mississippiensis TaxID=8496 RepID=A0A151MIG4_ALLMI|nr:hypothetical protein Y1Q_0004339 [Alligator mississippiensis]